MLHIELLAVENIDLRRKLLFFSFFSAILLGTFHARIVPKLAQLPTERYFIIKENVSGQNNKPFFFLSIFMKMVLVPKEESCFCS